MKAVDIYIDTSIKGPRRRDGSCLYILAFAAGNGRVADTGGRIRREGTTENQLALLGLDAALKRLRESCRLTLHLECAYVASALQNRWFDGWRYNDWVNAKNEPVRDADTWQSIEYLLNAHEFRVELRQPHTYRDWMRRELAGDGTGCAGASPARVPEKGKEKKHV